MDDRTMLAAMQGLTAKYGLDPFFYPHAVECADALLARLAETAPPAPGLEWDTAACTSFAEGHDREQAAQMGEPSPWAIDADADVGWRNERIAAVRAGLREVKIERPDPKPVDRAGPTPPPEADGDDIELSEAVKRAALAVWRKTYTSEQDQAWAVARAAIAVERAERPVVLPPGWVAVPVEPTEAMWRAGLGAAPAGMWSHMVAAAPPCPGVKEDKADD